MEREHRARRPHVPTAGSGLPVASFAVDEVALAALMEPVQGHVVCSSCDEAIAGDPDSSGLLVWSRGDWVDYDEPPLCASCAARIRIAAVHAWHDGDEWDE